MDEETEPTDFDLVAWLQAKMRDGLDKHFAEEVSGPAIFGAGNFNVVRGASGIWTVEPKSGHIAEHP